MKKEGIHKFLSLAIKLILVLSIVNGIFNSLWHIVSTDIFLLILIYIPEIVTKYKIEIPREFEWILLFFVIATLFLGRIGGVITPIIFGIAIGMIGFMILAILYSSNQIKKNYFLIIVFSFNFAVTLGFAIEILKYYLKKILGQDLNTGTYIFTMQTMTFVIIGAAISSLFGYLYMKNYTTFFRKLTRKFISKNKKFFIKKDDEIKDEIKKGENETNEFKSTLRINLHTNEIDKKIEHSSLKTITAFLNSKGGNLILGVSNDGEILGIEKDNFPNIDKFTLHLTNIIKEKIGKKYIPLIEIENYKINKKEIVVVRCKKSKTPVFLKPNKDEEEFYVRVGPSTSRINGSELIDYIEKRFSDKK